MTEEDQSKFENPKSKIKKFKVKITRPNGNELGNQ